MKSRPADPPEQPDGDERSSAAIGTPASSEGASAFRGRILIVAAACFWSVSGVFVSLLHAGDMPGIVIAAYRSLFAGVVLSLAFACSRIVRRTSRAPAASSQIPNSLWDYRMLSMIACFTLMTFTFIESMMLTNPANSVLLQYSATIWILIAGVGFLGEAMDRQNIVAVVGGLVGVAVLMVGNWQSGPNDRLGIIYGLISGVAYAGVVVHLRALRRFESLWLASLNHLVAGIVLWSFMIFRISDWSVEIPDGLSLGKLAVFGTVQMALPYFLFGLGLKSVTSQEAGLLTLIEPLLNPLWTFLFAGVATPTATIWGGAILLGTLVMRFIRLPSKRV